MKKIWVHVSHSFKEAKEWDLKFWRQAGSHVRFAAARSLIQDYMKMKGKSGHNLRLRRSVQNIERLPD